MKQILPTLPEETIYGPLVKPVSLNESASVCSNRIKRVSQVVKQREGWQHTPVGPKPTVSSLQQRLRHELTPEEAKEGFIKGVTKHIVLHFP